MPGEATPAYTVTVPSTPDGLEPLHGLVAEVRQQCPNVDGPDLDMLETAIIELAGNVVRHEHPTDATPLTLTVWVHERELEATLVGAGPALDLDLAGAELPDEMDEAGRGLAMVRLVVDDLAYRHDAGVNRWHLRRTRR